MRINKIFILLLLSLFLSNTISFAQINGPVGWIDFQDSTVVGDTTAKANAKSYLGGVFTPKDTIRVLVIYAGFWNGPGTDDEGLGYQIWDNGPNGTDHSTVPNYVTANGGSPIALFFNNASQFSDPQYENTRNLSNFYAEMSRDSFLIMD